MYVPGITLQFSDVAMAVTHPPPTSPIDFYHHTIREHCIKVVLEDYLDKE